MKFRCPKDPNHRRFYATTRAINKWIVDENGNYIETLYCSEKTPPDYHIALCLECDTRATVYRHDTYLPAAEKK